GAVDPGSNPGDGTGDEAPQMRDGEETHDRMNAGGRPAQGTRARDRGCAQRPTAPVACTSPRLRTVDRVRRGFKAAVIAARPGRRSARWPWIRDGRFTGADDRPAAPPRWSNGKDVRLSP